MKNLTPLVIFTLLLLSVMGLITGIFYWMAPAENKLERAFQNYHEAERSPTVEGREVRFNQALNLYMDLDRLYSPTRGNGKLYYNIANCYFQLEEYPFAILYYNRALNLMPRSDKVADNLRIAQSKLDIKADKTELTFQRLFFFHYYLSLPERYQFFFVFSLITLLFSSFYIWASLKIFKTIALIAFSVSVLFLSSIAYTHYLSPIEGVVVNASMLFRDAGKQYAVVSELPVLSGLKVKVLEVLNEGAWLKIETPDGELGYVPFESVRLIEDGT